MGEKSFYTLFLIVFYVGANGVLVLGRNFFSNASPADHEVLSVVFDKYIDLLMRLGATKYASLKETKY